MNKTAKKWLIGGGIVAALAAFGIMSSKKNAAVNLMSLRWVNPDTGNVVDLNSYPLTLAEDGKTVFIAGRKPEETIGIFSGDKIMWSFDGGNTFPGSWVVA